MLVPVMGTSNCLNIGVHIVNFFLQISGQQYAHVELSMVKSDCIPVYNNLNNLTIYNYFF